MLPKVRVGCSLEETQRYLLRLADELDRKLRRMESTTDERKQEKEEQA